MSACAGCGGLAWIWRDHEYVHAAMRNGGDAVKALERYLEQLPSPLTEEELHKLMQP